VTRPAATDSEIRSFYQAALLCLRFVEARKPTGRRFGADADALWRDLRGELSTADRIDILVRDADAEWPGAFAARRVFALPGVAEDEPLGPAWRSLDVATADDLWQATLARPAPSDPAATLTACASAWGLALHPVSVGDVNPAARLCLLGPSAITATARAFAAGRDLDWSEQVVCVAGPPAHRQLATLAAAILNAPAGTRLLSPGESLKDLKDHPASGALASPARIDRCIFSEDADPAERATAIPG
jgi:hypothetical protein